MIMKKKSRAEDSGRPDSAIFKETHVLQSPEETLKFAKRLAAGLKPGSVLALSGGLGSGNGKFILYGCSLLILGFIIASRA